MTSALRTALGATHVEVIDMSGGGERDMEVCWSGVEWGGVGWRGSLVRGVMLGSGGWLHLVLVWAPNPFPLTLHDPL